MTPQHIDQGAGAALPNRRHRRLVALVVFVACWTLTTHGKYSASGDEPHYLIVSQSLLADGDIDLRNNMANGESRRFGVDALEAGLHVRESRSGRLLPVHDIGLPIALVPVYAVATLVADATPARQLQRFRMSQGLFAYSLISLFLIGLTAAAAVWTRDALVTGGASAPAAAVVVLAAWLSPPVLSNSFLVFPEVAALVATAWAVRASVMMTAGRRVPGSWLGMLAPLALLPWFHRKFVVYVGAMVVTLAWRHRRVIAVWPARQRWSAAAVIALPTALLLVWSWTQWGSFGGALMTDGVPLGWQVLRVGALGQLVDRENGLLIWAPIYVLLPAAWALAGRGAFAWVLPPAALYLLTAAHDQWWAGFSPAARFLFPLVPIFCLAGAAVTRHGLLAKASAALLVPQVLISAYGWQHPRALWPQGDGRNRVLGPLLQSVGLSDSLLPALRVSTEGVPAALVLVLIVAALNLAAWLAVRLAAGAPAHPPTESA